MSKLVVFNLITLDGFFEGPNREIDWHHVDAEFNDFAINQLNSLGLLVFGRVTYELMAAYWPSPIGIRDDPQVAGLMNNIPKIVFSRTLERAEWSNTRLIKEDLAGEIKKLKQQPGKDMAIFGSGVIVSSLAELGLIDEYRIIVNPVILGKGNSMFKGFKEKIELKLTKTKPFRNGNILLYYEPANRDGSQT